MTHPPFVIVIATCGRHPLLNRLLETLARCTLPPNRTRIVLAENGTSKTGDLIARAGASHFPIEHRHTRQPNKSVALNHAIADAADDEFALFFDDDVRVHPGTLLAYSEAIRQRTHSAFFGGQCLVDYDQPPAPWLIPYLPASAKGWSLGHSIVRIQKPHALGFNWAARVGDIRGCGGFDPARGPGTPIGIGDESDLQQRLLAAGVHGFYLPAARVSHYVPPERCSERWTLDRALQNGFVRGLNISPTSNRASMSARYRIRFIRTSLMLMVARLVAAPDKRFHYEYWQRRHSGMLAGLRVATCRHASCNAHAV